MLMLSLVRALAVLVPWMFNLAIWALARSFNLPEPVVHDTGAFVFAQVQTIENLFGEIVVVAQAIATGVFAELQYIGLRRSGGAVAA